MSETRSREEVQREIAETRAQLTDTAAALAAKTDVKAQVKQAVAEARDQVAEKADQVRRQFTDGEPREVVRRPVPLTVMLTAAVGIVAIVTAMLRRRRR